MRTVEPRKMACGLLIDPTEVMIRLVPGSLGRSLSSQKRMLPFASPDVVYQPLPDGAVLFHPVQEVYFGLNTVGARTWELLPPRCGTLEQLADELAKSYPEVPREQIRDDVEQLLGELLANGLVTPHAEAPSAH